MGKGGTRLSHEFRRKRVSAGRPNGSKEGSKKKKSVWSSKRKGGAYRQNFYGVTNFLLRTEGVSSPQRGKWEGGTR